MTTVLREGEVITCENDHDVCIATQDMGEGDIPDMFDWVQPEPELGADFDTLKCNVCGARWVRTHDGFLLFYVRGRGWVGAKIGKQ